MEAHWWISAVPSQCLCFLTFFHFLSHNKGKWQHRCCTAATGAACRWTAGLMAVVSQGKQAQTQRVHCCLIPGKSNSALWSFHPILKRSSSNIAIVIETKGNNRSHSPFIHLGSTTEWQNCRKWFLEAFTGVLTSKIVPKKSTNINYPLWLYW